MAKYPFSALFVYQRIPIRAFDLLKCTNLTIFDQFTALKHVWTRPIRPNYDTPSNCTPFLTAIVNNNKFWSLLTPLPFPKRISKRCIVHFEKNGPGASGLRAQGASHCTTKMTVKVPSTQTNWAIQVADPNFHPLLATTFHPKGVRFKFREDRWFFRANGDENWGLPLRWRISRFL